MSLTHLLKSWATKTRQRGSKTTKQSRRTTPQSQIRPTEPFRGTEASQSIPCRRFLPRRGLAYPAGGRNPVPGIRRAPLGSASRLFHARMGFPLVVVIAWAFARSPGRSDYILEKRYCQSLITGDLETFQNTMRRYPPCPSLKAANRPHGDTGA